MSALFLSTLSLRRATAADISARREASISIHALLAESDFGCFGRFAADSAYFYPRSPCGERQQQPTADGDDCPISIHALLAESDLAHAALQARQKISIHALLAESDGTSSWATASSRTFLSTLSLRRATPSIMPPKGWTINFYPRSPCGERPGAVGFLGFDDLDFYPRSPCGERPRRANNACK